MRDAPSPNSTARRTVAAEPQQPTNDLSYTAGSVARLSVASIAQISEEQARQLVESPLTPYGRAGKDTPTPASSRYLGSDYYELRPSGKTNSHGADISILRLTEQMSQSHDEIAGASISLNGNLSHRSGLHLGKAYPTTSGSIVVQIPRWQQED
jgi:hypothetical protein